jgi:hypothetical protein
MVDELSTKSFEYGYPSDAMEILKAMSFTDGEGVNIVGSMSLRSQQYAGDYDADETVKLNYRTDRLALKKLAQRFKHNIKKLKEMKNVFIGDCKSGVINEWRVIPRDAMISHGKIVNYDKYDSLRKLEELKDDGIITASEAKTARKYLRKSGSLRGFVAAKSKVKFHLIRWSAPEILDGHKLLRDGRKYTLEEAFSSPTITKLDTIGLVQNNRFTDFSMIYKFTNRGRVLNPDEMDIVKSIKESIIYYRSIGESFKVLKREFSLAKFTDNMDKIHSLIPILNSDLGRMYHVLGDVKTLIDLLEHNNPSMKAVKFELDQFKGRLSTIYTFQDFLKMEHKIIEELNTAIDSDSKADILPNLEKLKDRLEKSLNVNTIKTLNRKTKTRRVKRRHNRDIEDVRY